MGKLSNYTLAGIEAQLYPTRAAEFRRGKDKKKRKSRSLRDNIMGTTTAGRIARGVGAAGALALGGRSAAKAISSRIMMPGAGRAALGRTTMTGASDLPQGVVGRATAKAKDWASKRFKK